LRSAHLWVSACAMLPLSRLFLTPGLGAPDSPKDHRQALDVVGADGLRRPAGPHRPQKVSHHPGVTADLVAAFSAASVNGELALNLDRATVGGVPIPVTMLAPLENTLNDNLQQALDRLPENYTIASVTVGEGQMTIVATP